MANSALYLLAHVRAGQSVEFSLGKGAKLIFVFEIM
jgi:hypothetical protein